MWGWRGREVAKCERRFVEGGEVREVCVQYILVSGGGVLNRRKREK